MAEFLSSNPTVTLFVFGCIVIFVIVMIVLGLREQKLSRRQQESALASRELAVIAEEIRTTGGGGFCIAMLILTVTGSSISYLMVTTVFQQIEVSVSMISGLILFGLGAALGRRRTYRIYRSENRTDL
jgi:ABC-type multidrug transport system fused ATPase/permease subunit